MVSVWAICHVGTLGCAVDARCRRTALDRPFFLFPGRSAGLALLGLRLLAGAGAIVAGSAYADGWSTLISSRVTGLVLVIDGLLLVLGLFTRVAGFIAPALACAAAFNWILPVSPWFAEIRAVALPFAVVSLSLVALGPGAYSMDARLFGRKQLHIPPRTPSKEA